MSLTSGWWTGAANQARLNTILRLTVVLMLVFLLLAVLDACGTATPARSAKVGLDDVERVDSYLL